MTDDAIQDILEQTESDPAFQALFDLFDYGQSSLIKQNRHLLRLPFVLISVCNYMAFDSTGKGRTTGPEEAEEGQRDQENVETTCVEEPAHSDQIGNGQLLDCE